MLALVGNLVVPEADHADAARREPLRAAIVLERLIEMSAPVHLDAQASSGTIGVEDVRADGMLTPEAVSTEASSPKLLPEPLLDLRRVATQPACQIDASWSVTHELS